MSPLLVEVLISDAQTLPGQWNRGRRLGDGSGSNVAPGESIGSLTVTGNASIAGSLAVEYNGGAAPAIDMLAVSGNLDLTAGTINFASIGALLTAPAYVFASYGTLSGAALNVSGTPLGYNVDYDYQGGDQIALVQVPEPSTLALLAGGLFGLLAYAWRKRK